MFFLGIHPIIQLLKFMVESIILGSLPKPLNERLRKYPVFLGTRSVPAPIQFEVKNATLNADRDEFKLVQNQTDGVGFVTAFMILFGILAKPPLFVGEANEYILRLNHVFIGL